MILTRQTYFLFTNGILCDANKWDTWNKQAAQAIYDRGGEGGEFSYTADIIGGAVKRTAEAKDLAATLYGSQRLANTGHYNFRAAVGHSDGCPMTIEAMLADGRIRLDELHLFAPATTDDCEKNGLNKLARDYRVKRIILYVSPTDEALGPGSLVGYGILGKAGPNPATVCPELANILTIRHRRYFHSDWVGTHFDEMLDLVTGVLTQ